MNTIVCDLREIILHRFRTASLKELLELSPAPTPTVAQRIADRFEVDIGDTLDGYNAVVIDHQTGLTWLRDYVPGGSRNWKDSMDTASSLDIRGWKWRAPTIVERLSINDYERHNPAVNTDFFKGEAAWEWTSTVDNSSPRDRAWVVNFSYGFSLRYLQYGFGFVRAVRVGQF